MRLDLVLKYSKLFKRRAVAKYYCDKGLVFVNGKKGKPSTDIKDNDIVELRMRNQTLKFLVNIKLECNKILLSYNVFEEENYEGKDA